MEGWQLLTTGPRVPRLVGRPLLCLTDIAGDLAALETVLSAVRDVPLAGIVACGNHVVGGASPFEVWTRLQGLGAAMTCGPTDLAVAALDHLDRCEGLKARTAEDEARLQAFLRARQALGDVVCRRLGELPTTTVLSLDDTRGVMALYGSPADDDDPLVDDDGLLDRVAAVAEDVLVCSTGTPFGRRLTLPSIVPTIDDEGEPVAVAPPRQLLVVGLGAVGVPPGVVAPRRRNTRAVLVGAGDDGFVHAWSAELAVTQKRARRAV